MYAVENKRQSVGTILRLINTGPWGLVLQSICGSISADLVSAFHPLRAL